MPTIDSTPVFQAKFPENYTQPATNSLADLIFQYFHKKLGLYILPSQGNPNNVTSEEKILAHEKLKALGGQRVSFKAADNTDIKGMHFIGKNCVENSPTLILFNGNGLRYEEYGSQTMSAIRIFTIKYWLKLGVNVLIFNYRGIDKDQGSATRNGVILDGDAAFQYTRDVMKVPEDHIILHGHSLGGGIASEVGVIHPDVNYCNDRSFSSLSEQVRMMLGGGKIGSIGASLIRKIEWEFDTLNNWNKIKGHKWIITHPHDPVILSKLASEIKAVDSNAHIIEMFSQWIPSKKGPRPENISLKPNPTMADFSFAATSCHMRKLKGREEKALYEKELEFLKK